MTRKKSDANIALGAAIRAVRSARGQTQESFAGDAGIDRSYYGAIERGEFNLTIETLSKIARALDVAAWELLRRAGLWRRAGL